MLEQWKKYRLGDLVEQPRDITYGVVQPGKDTANGIPIIKVNNITSKDYSSDRMEKLESSIEEKYLRSRLIGNEILISLVGSLGHLCLVDQTMIGWNVARAVGVLPIKSEYDRNWIYYYLQSFEAQNNLKNTATTSVQATINLKELKEIEIPYPTNHERAKIVEILSALDDKIELNKQMNKTLEKTASVIYKNWFVNFEPFKNKKFINSELGLIPEGWSVKSFYQIAHFFNGTAIKQNQFSITSEGKPVIKIAELKQGITFNTRFTDHEFDDKSNIKSSDLLFSWSGNPYTSIDIFIWDKMDAILNQHIFKVVPDLNFDKAYIYFTIKYYLNLFITLATNKQTTGLGHFTIEDLKTNYLVVPSLSDYNLYKSLANNHFELLFSNLLEIESLKQTRNYLLKKLTSGEITIQQATKRIKEMA